MTLRRKNRSVENEVAFLALCMDIDVLFKRETVAVEAGNNWQDKPGPGPDWVGGHLPSAWCQQLHSTPSQSRCEDCEVVSCFKSYIITSW